MQRGISKTSVAILSTHGVKMVIEFLTRDELKSRLEKLQHATICSIIALTSPTMRKTGNPWNDVEVVKLSRVGGFICWTYSKSVNNQRDREQKPTNADGSVEQFVAAARQWGKRIKGSPFVEHKGSFYLEVKVQSARSPEYFNAADGIPITADSLDPWLPKRKTEAGRQGVEKPVIVRDYRLDGIAQIKLKSKTLVVRDHMGALQRYNSKLKATGQTSVVLAS